MGDFGTSVLERLVLAVRRIRGDATWRIVYVVTGQKRKQLANQLNRVLVVFGSEVGDAALLVVRQRATELFLRDFFMCDGADDIRPGHEHVARVLHHDREVGDRR